MYFSSAVMTPLGLVISILLLVFTAAAKKIHPFFALLISSVVFALFSKMPVTAVFHAFFTGVGGTIASVGLIIAIGTLTGCLLQRCGGAEAMAQAILKRTGTRYADVGMAVTGYLVSLAVFCDAAYVILAPLAKRLSRVSGTSMCTMSLSLCFAMLTTNQLIPPTAGPLAAAGVLHVDMGMAILLSIAVSIPVMVVNCVLSRYFGCKERYAYQIEDDGVELVELNDRPLPSALEAFAPILLPLVLMIGKTLIALLLPSVDWLNTLMQILGQPLIALSLGLLVAIRTYKRICPDDNTMATYDGVFGDAMKTAGQIVLIVGAGGGLGGLLGASELQPLMTHWLTGIDIGLLAPFIIGVILRTAIGSASITLLTGASMIAPMLGVLGLGSPVGLVLALLSLGSGACAIVHGNDNYFWMVTSCSEMKSETAFRLIPKLSIVLALTALLFTWILKLFLL